MRRPPKARAIPTEDTIRVGDSRSLLHTMRTHAVPGARVVLFSLVLMGLVACSGDSGDGGPVVSGSDPQPVETGSSDDADDEQSGPESSGSIVVTIGEQTFEFVTAPPKSFDFDGNMYGSCSVDFGTMRANGYAADGSDVVVKIQVTEPGETGSWIVIEDADPLLEREVDAKFLWRANGASLGADDPLYHEVAEDRQIDESTASGSATFVDAVAETPEQVAGSFEVNCGS